MKRVAILTDSTAFLPDQYIKQYDIEVIPLQIIWGNETFQDGVSLSPSDFYTRLKTTRDLPTTSQPSVGKFKDVMEKLISKENDILGIFISSKLSGTFHSAIQAKTLIPNTSEIVIIDSTSTTLAMGFQVLAAAKAASDGATLKDCCHIVEQVRKNSGVFFMVDTLEFLHRGGRIGGAQRFLGTALGTKPILHMQDGKIEPLERVRTKSKAMDRLVELTIEKCHGQSNIHLAGIHANAEYESQKVLEKAGQYLAPTQTMIAELSPVVGIHAGPGTIALAHMFGN